MFALAYLSYIDRAINRHFFQLGDIFYQFLLEENVYGILKLDVNSKLTSRMSVTLTAMWSGSLHCSTGLREREFGVVVVQSFTPMSVPHPHLHHLFRYIGERRHQAIGGRVDSRRGTSRLRKQISHQSMYDF